MVIISNRITSRNSFNSYNRTHNILSYWFYKNRVYLAQKKEILNESDKKEVYLSNTSIDISLSELDNKVLKTIAKLIVVKQSDLPRIIDEPRSSVSESLSFLENNNLIIKKKEGRTFKVELNQENIKLLEN